MSATANFFSLLHCLAGFHLHRAAFQMRQQTVFAVRVFDEHGISSDASRQPIHPKCADVRSVANSIARLDHHAVGGRKNWCVKTKIIFKFAPVTVKRTPILPIFHKVISESLAWDAPRMGSLFCDAAIKYSPLTRNWQNIIHLLFVSFRFQNRTTKYFFRNSSGNLKKTLCQKQGIE